MFVFLLFCCPKDVVFVSKLNETVAYVILCDVKIIKFQCLTRMLRLIILSVLTVGALSAPGGHNVVKKSGNVPAKFPMWHLEPLYIKKIPASNQEKRSVDSNSVSQVHQSHSVFTNVNGNQNSLTQQMEEGKV